MEQAQIEKEQLDLAMAVRLLPPVLHPFVTNCCVLYLHWYNIQEERRERLEEASRKAELG